PHCDVEERAVGWVSGVDPVSACHSAEELAGDGPAAEVFETAETDSQAIEQLDQLGDLEEAKAELDQAEAAEEAEERA
ncbi:MAG: hypothetical protein ABW222_15930, partial [Actinomycetota bacterium]